MKVKNRTLLVLVLLFFLFFLTACEAESPFVADPKVTEPKPSVLAERPDPDNLAFSIIERLSADKPKDLLKDIYPAALERYGEEQIVTRNFKIHHDLEIEEIRYQNLRQIPESKTEQQVFYSVDVSYRSRYGEFSGQQIFSLIWHPAVSAWQLEWTPSLILPGLNETGRVQVEILEAQRGEIFDRQGFPLAINQKIVEVSAVPRYLSAEKIPQVNELLGLPAGTVEEFFAQAWVKEDTLVPLGYLPSLQEVDYKQFKDLGLQWQEQDSRYYPFREVCSPLIGYVGEPSATDLQEISGITAQTLLGKTGLEAIHDTKLRGVNGYRIYISGKYEQSLMERPAVDGQDLFLSLDAVLQRDLYKLMEGRDAICTALDPKSGELLALVSSPAYDAQEFVLGIAPARYEALLNDPKLPLTAKFATAISPGSTQKLATAIIGLRNGSIDFETKKYIEGKTWQPDASWGDYGVTRYMELNQEFDLEDAFVYSDNIFYAQFTLEMGAEKFNEGMRLLGAETEICPDYPFRKTQISNQGPISDDQPILLADSSYGQGELLYTQAHMAQIYSSVLNGGYLKPLNLILENPQSDSADSEKVKSDENANSAVNDEAKDSKILRKEIKILEEDNISALRAALDRVVEEQHAKYMKRESVELSGKSGTAELGKDALGEMRVNSWFIGYERKNPNICLALTLFDSQQYENKFLTHELFADIFTHLYAKKPYQLARPKFEKIYDFAKIPPYENRVELVENFADAELSELGGDYSELNVEDDLGEVLAP